MTKQRDSWEFYFLRIARMVATRSTCTRAQHGCVLVRDNAILSTGYNGSAPGLPHCTDVGCDMEAGHCVRCNHAEENAIYQAARNGVALAGSVAYVTGTPCWRCFRALVTAGIRRIYFGSDYRPDRRTSEAAEALGVEFVKVNIPTFQDQPEFQAAAVTQGAGRRRTPRHPARRRELLICLP